MATQVTMTTAADLLKRWYVDKKKLHVMDGSANALLKAVQKDPTLEGDSWSQPIIVNSIVGGAANYTIGRGNSTAGTDKVFRGGIKERYDFADVSQKVISTSKTSRGGFVPILQQKLDGVKRQNQRWTNFQMFRDEGGAIGVVGTVSANATGTFDTTTKTAVQFLAPGHNLVAGPNKDGTSLRSGGVTILSKNDKDGTFKTVSPVAINTNITTLTAGDYWFIAGTSGSTDQALAGLESWIPPTEALAATSFKNCDRSVDTRALAGNRIDASTAGSIEEAYIDAVATIEQYEGEPKAIFTHPLRYAQLSKELGDRKRYVTQPGQSFLAKGKKDARISYGGISVEGASGDVMVVKDAACQYGYSWIIDPSNFTLYSCGPWPFWRGEGTDGLKMLRATDSNGYVSELFAFGEFVCEAPGKNGIIVH